MSTTTFTLRLHLNDKLAGYASIERCTSRGRGKLDTSVTILGIAVPKNEVAYTELTECACWEGDTPPAVCTCDCLSDADYAEEMHRLLHTYAIPMAERAGYALIEDGSVCGRMDHTYQMRGGYGPRYISCEVELANCPAEWVEQFYGSNA